MNSEEALTLARDKSSKTAEKFIEIVNQDIEEASNSGVTRIREHEIQGSMLIGLIDYLVSNGFNVDYEEDGDLSTGVVSYPTYSLTIDWSGRLEEMEIGNE
ncbi:hypothetical protein GBO93_07175 [Pediococcus acidilactici]|uniref:hypothetical protein n=1 Tax=Pediococcus acidilactici TaxID=1254 RepID=UPI00132AF0A9|nr:hypothetical protein [Pediococcus acidilactici]KAF0343813.1 hypothetical protein GBO43_08405 [Pediococcus acidilactici]KAF0357968.1 hypothetical protein GBO51_08440 [Pediococcus acidilactici]KAF0361791.1 hypothetical protein GBO53_09305 [Pediococcus acidilactici]KAF0408493.1 hypothetical protein GBO74_08960 [Pediococcus acidilactici]KAF0430753.1 hypothetical protein GBO88_08405 [Pediococcus acidilactici]